MENRKTENEPNEMTNDEAKAFCNKLKFGDLLTNHWAGENNPKRISMFVKRSKFDGQPSIYTITLDGKNDAHYHIKSGMKMSVNGNAFASITHQPLADTGSDQNELRDKFRPLVKDMHGFVNETKVEKCVSVCLEYAASHPNNELLEKAIRNLKDIVYSCTGEQECEKELIKALGQTLYNSILNAKRFLHQHEQR